MKRSIIVICILLAFVGLMVTALPLFVSSESVRTRILSQIQGLTGRTVAFRGNPTVSLNPFLGVEISDLVVADPLAGPNEPPLLSIERLKGRLNIFPAFLGRADIEEYKLLRPRLRLKVSADGTSNWVFQSGQLHDALEQTANEDSEDPSQPIEAVVLGNFEIEDGAIDYENEISGQTEMITNISGSLSWPSTTQLAHIAGSGVWRGEGIEAKFSVDNPLKLFSGNESGLVAEFNSTPLGFRFSGNANMLSDLYFAGRISATSPSLGRLSEILNLDIGYLGHLEELQAEGEISATAEAMKLTDAEVTLSGNAATGVIQIARDEVGIRKLNGTLAFGDIDASHFFFDNEHSGELGVSELMRDIQLDLRVSANSLTAEGVTLNNLAAAITLQNNKLTFDIGDSEAFGGSVIARVGENSENEDRYVFLDVSARGIDAEKVGSLFPAGMVRISGTTDIDASLRSYGKTRAMLIRELNGEITTKFENGEIGGIDLLALLNSGSDGGSTTQPLDGAGASEFQHMAIKMFINRGIASISKGLIEADEANVQLYGHADLFEGSLAVRAQKLIDQIPEEDRLFIGGSLKAPLVTLEPAPLRKIAPENSTATEDSDISN